MELKKGDKIAQYTFVKDVGKHKGQRKVLVICLCGKEVIRNIHQIRKKTTSICYCNRVNHGLFIDPATGKKHHLYSKWEGFKARCNNPNNDRYKRYGARGITVCQEWSEDFSVFLKWAEENGWHEGLTLDRIDNDGNYCPENCRWATQKTQGNNRSTNIRITHGGLSLTRSEWSDKLGFGYHVLKNRINRGWDIEKAINTPVGSSRGQVNQKRHIYVVNGKKMTIAQISDFAGIKKGTIKDNIERTGIDATLKKYNLKP